jgi:hypothetical protein
VDREWVVARIQSFFREQLAGEVRAQDWWHVHRVWQTAFAGGKSEFFAE